MRADGPSDRRFDGRAALWLGGVVAAHAVALLGVAAGLGKPAPAVTPPEPLALTLSAPAPSPARPKAAPAAPKPPRAATRPRPAPAISRPVAPPSERAPTVAMAPPAPARAAEPSEESMTELPGDAAEALASPGPEASEPGPELAPLILPSADAEHLSNPAPVYPALSRRFAEEGRVLLDVYILPDGSVGEVKVRESSGYSRLDGAAVAAVRAWRYVPARRGDERIPAWHVQPIRFSLSD